MVKFSPTALNFGYDFGTPCRYDHEANNYKPYEVGKFDHIQIKKAVKKAKRGDLLLFVAADSEDQKALARTLPFGRPPSLTTTGSETQPSFDIWKNCFRFLCGNVFDNHYMFLEILNTTILNRPQYEPKFPAHLSKYLSHTWWRILSSKSFTFSPFWETAKNVSGVVKNFFGHFCQKADETSGQDIPNQKNRLQKYFLLRATRAWKSS